MPIDATPKPENTQLMIWKSASQDPAASATSWSVSAPKESSMGGNPASTYLPLHPGLNSGNVSLKSRVLENNGGMTGTVVLV